MEELRTYTLTRDGERDLRFKGEVVAEMSDHHRQGPRSTRWFLIFFSLISACGEVVDPPGNNDKDGDGWTADVDCADNDSRVWPGQTEFFTTPCENNVNHLPFDFNCDGEEELESTRTVICQLRSQMSCGGSVFPGAWAGENPPKCGERGTWVTSCRWMISMCGISSKTDKTQACR